MARSGATGKGRGSVIAVLLGLTGLGPTPSIQMPFPASWSGFGPKGPSPPGHGTIAIAEKTDVLFYGSKTLPFHKKELTFTTYGLNGEPLLSQTYYSVRGGFVISEQVADDGSRHKAIAPDTPLLSADLPRLWM
jgi:L-serine dehydratase